MAAEGGAVAKDDELHASAGDGHVHATEIAEEANLALVVAAHKGDKDDVALLTLKAVDGVDGDEAAEGLEELALLDETTQQLNLCAVGRDDAYVEPLAQYALLSYHLVVCLKGKKGEVGLGSVGN